MYSRAKNFRRSAAFAVKLALGCFGLMPLTLRAADGPQRAADKMDAWRSGLHGANTMWKRSEADLRVLRQDFGANVARLLGNTTPLRSPQHPHAFIEENWTLLHRVCDAARRVGLYVVIDPHTTPGTARATTTSPQDPLWQDARYHDLLVETWARLAREFKGRPEVIGYDLLNEPGIPGDAPPGSAGDWNGLVRRLIAAVRTEDQDTPIVVEPPVVMKAGRRIHNRITGLEYLTIDPREQRIVYSPHFYEPHTFTHQGVNNLPFGVTYPGCTTRERAADGTTRDITWNRAEIARALAPAVKFAREHQAIIFMGEFSANRLAAGGDEYVRDLIAECDAQGWSWAYHSFREASIWDSELGADPKNRVPLSDAPRKQILKAAMSHNRVFLPPP